MKSKAEERKGFSDYELHQSASRTPQLCLAEAVYPRVTDLAGITGTVSETPLDFLVDNTPGPCHSPCSFLHHDKDCKGVIQRAL